MKKVIISCKFCVLTLSFLMVFLPSHTFAKDIVLVASQDTSITEHTMGGGAESTHGGDPILQVNGAANFRSVPMLKFDFTSLANSVVTGDALFSIYVRDIHPKYATTQKNISLYTWSTLDWDENTVTFNHIQFTTGRASLPSDLAMPKLGTVPVDTSNKQTSISFTIPRAIIQGWIDDPASNHGVALVNEQTGAGHDVIFNASGESKGTEPSLSFTTN